MEHSNQIPEHSSSAVIVRHPDPHSTHVPYPAGAPYGYEGVEDNGTGGLLEYWRILRRHKKLLCIFAFAGAVLGIAIGLPQKPVYRVRTSLEVLSLNGNFMNMKGTSPVTTNDDYSYDTSEEETQVKLLQSDSLLEQVLDKLDPGRALRRSQPHPAMSPWQKLLHVFEPSHTSKRERLLGKLANSLKVRLTPRTRIIEVTAESTNPSLALEFVNTLTSQFIQASIDARWKTSERTSKWLNHELNEERTKLAHAEDALQAYARDSGLIFTTDNNNGKSDLATEKLQQVQQQLTAATADRIAKQSNYELAKNAPPDSLPDVVNDKALRQEQTNINDLKGKIANLSAIFAPGYGGLKQAENQLAALQKAYDNDRAAVIERIGNDYREALHNENLLEARYEAQEREVTGLDEKAIQYNILKREVDSHRQLYDTMLQQMKQSTIASALNASNVRIVDPAELPTSPVWPNFKLLGALGFFLGLFLGLGTVIVRERADRSLQQPGEAQLWTNLPELGTIPSASIDGVKRGGKRLPPFKSLPKSLPGIAQRERAPSVELITWERKPSLMAEAFRSALTSILFVGENGSRPRVLVLTSANTADGKTTVVSNLAIAMAEIRRRVLVIDADLRRPRMHNLFDVPNDRGLSDLLREEILSDETINPLIQKTEIPGLDVLPSGPATHAAANLLYSPNLAELLKRFKAQYDMVLIDTPPMLQMTDARVVGRLADAVVLVARAEETTRDAIIAAKERFSEDRIRVLGTILNDWDPKRSPNGYYGYYKGSYYRSYAEEPRSEVAKSI